MIHFLEVVYYYCYLFYANKIWFDNTPHITALLVLGAAISFFVDTLFNIFIAYYWGLSFSIEINLLIGITVIYGIYLLIFKVGGGKEIIQKKPTLLKSKSFSIVTTILFMGMCFSSMFWGAIVVKDLVDNFN